MTADKNARKYALKLDTCNLQIKRFLKLALIFKQAMDIL